METNKNIDTLEGAISEAEGLEQAAKAEPDYMSYTHTFKKPFVWEGKSYDELTFDWGGLTGADHLEIENELLMRGKTLVVPEFTSDFLIGMALRACTEKQANGRRVLDARAFKALPLRDFQIICKKARSFLQRAGS